MLQDNAVCEKNRLLSKNSSEMYSVLTTRTHFVNLHTVLLLQQYNGEAFDGSDFQETNELLPHIIHFWKTDIKS